MRTKKFLSEVMTMAWQFVKRNGFTMGEALKTAWANMKLKVQLSKRIVEFYFKKTDGTLRQAFGTLVSERIPETKGVKKTADNCQVYFDTEKERVSPKTRLYSFSRFQYYAHNLDSLNKKNGMSATPLN